MIQNTSLAQVYVMEHKFEYNKSDILAQRGKDDIEIMDSQSTRNRVKINLDIHMN